MKKGKDIRFKHAWWQSLRTFSREVRDEVFCAICEYGMEQTEPEQLSDMARGIFSQIRIDIDERTAHEEQVRETRKRTGHLGAVKTNAMRWGESQQKSANVGKSRQMSANADGTAQNDAELSANADNLSANVGKSRQMPIVSPDPSTMQNNIYNYIFSHSHNACAQGFDTVLGWLVDDTERLKLEFYRLGLLTNTDNDECARVIAPYVDAFFEQNDYSADWERKGRRDTKAHFSSWVRRHKNLEENGTTRPTETGRTRTTAGEAYDAIAVGIAIAEAERNAGDGQ